MAWHWLGQDHAQEAAFLEPLTALVLMFALFVCNNCCHCRLFGLLLDYFACQQFSCGQEDVLHFAGHFCNVNFVLVQVVVIITVMFAFVSMVAGIFGQNLHFSSTTTGTVSQLFKS